MSVAHVHGASPPVSRGSGIRTSTAAQHAVVMWQQAVGVYDCCRALYLLVIFCVTYHELWRGIRWKINRLKNVSRNSEKFLKFNLTVHQISLYQTGVVFFFLYRKCPLQPYSHNDPVNHYLPRFQVLLQREFICTPSYIVTSYIHPVLIKNHYLLRHASVIFYVVTHQAYESVTASLLNPRLHDRTDCMRIWCAHCTGYEAASNVVVIRRCVRNLLNFSRRCFPYRKEWRVTHLNFSRNVLGVQLPISSAHNLHVLTSYFRVSVSHVTWSLQGLTYGWFGERRNVERRCRLLNVFTVSSSWRHFEERGKERRT